MKTDNTIILSDGRRLGYAEYGDANGKPVFLFHGCPGSRFDASLVEEKLSSLNARCFAIDRPGMGLSDYQRKRSILDFPDDLLELANHLQLSKFAVLGVSGGGPYALACAYKIPPNCLTGCAVVSGTGNYHTNKAELSRDAQKLLFIAKYFPSLVRVLLWREFGRNVDDKDWWDENYSKFSVGLPEPDKQIILNPDMKDRIIRKSIEAFRQGSKGPAYDFKLYAKSWGFALDELPSETRIFIFHGELDKNVPIGIVQVMSKSIPNCKTSFYPNEGHMSVFVNKLEDILSLIFVETT